MSDQYDGPLMAQQILRLQAAQHGMTLRDWFAGQALVSLYASKEVQENEWGDELIADLCYDMADAMLKAREVKP